MDFTQHPAPKAEDGKTPCQGSQNSISAIQQVTSEVDRWESCKLQKGGGLLQKDTQQICCARLIRSCCLPATTFPTSL